MAVQTTLGLLGRPISSGAEAGASTPRLGGFVRNWHSWQDQEASPSSLQFRLFGVPLPNIDGSPMNQDNSDKREHPEPFQFTLRHMFVFMLLAIPSQPVVGEASFLISRRSVRWLR